MAFKRQEREAAAAIMAGDRYCPDPSAHEHRAASQERPKAMARCETCGHLRGEHHARRAWEANRDDSRLRCYHSNGGMVADCACREFTEDRAASRERPQPDNPRDTPHLDRNGDRWREHPSEARLAETDAGPRSESRSVASGGWQGGPSGDIQRAIAIIEDSRQTHVNWAEWRRKGNGTDTDHEMIGDLEWHEAAIRDYDHVLAVLRASQERPQPTIEQLAAEQGIKRITNADDLRIDGLTDEEADSFMDALAFLERPQPVHDIGPGYCRTCDPGFGHNHPDWQERPSIDVERLAEAGGNVLDGRRIGSVRLYRNTITPDDWSAIAAEYLRLSGLVGE